MPADDTPPGDLGGERADGPPPPLSHRRLEERALLGDWPLVPSVRVAILKRLAAIVEDPLAKPRAVTAAARALVHAYNAGQRLGIDRATLELARARVTSKADKFVLSDLVAEAEAAALAFTPAERPEGK